MTFDAVRRSPPRARLAFRVGVVGHRPDRLPRRAADVAALGARIRTVLDAVRTATLAFQTGPGGVVYADQPPLLQAVSPLAEGADRLFAEAALDLGYGLCCPTPFALDEFGKDFDAPAALEAGSRERFQSLLDRARAGAGLTVFELDGDRQDPGAAYGAAGRVVLGQSDLLVVIWDGMEPKGAGGTVETLKDALRFHVPVLWIDAVAPFNWMLLRSDGDLDGLTGTGRRTPGRVQAADAAEDNRQIAEAVAGVVREELAPPKATEAEAEAHVGDYFRERRPVFNLAFLWKLFRNAVGDSAIRLPPLRTTDFEAEVERNWPGSPDAAESSGSSSAVHWVNARLRGAYAWSDKLADLYGDRYRSAFILSYLLAALAVLVALIPTAMAWPPHTGPEIWLIVGELAIMITIVGLLIWGRSQRWHERWMEYRLFAELIRQLKFLIPLGGGRPLPRTPTHLSVYGDPAQSWTYWQLRALARATGIPSARVTPAYVATCLEDLAEIADGEANGQRAFHKTSCERSETIHRRLHLGSLILFGLTIVGVVLHLAPYLESLVPEPVRAEIEHRTGWLVLGSAFLPALGAALVGINNHGEFLRIAKRSHAMADGFKQYAERIQELRRRLSRGEAVPLAEVVPLAGAMAQTMVDEVADWRVVVLDRPQTAG